MSTSIVEITAQLEGIDAKQAASTEAQIQNEFERLGSRLNLALSLGLGAALLLAAGCLLYIFRIERQNARRYQEVLKARKALEQLSARLVDAQEMERRTISRELHDQVGQTLNACWWMPPIWPNGSSRMTPSVFDTWTTFEVSPIRA